MQTTRREALKVFGIGGALVVTAPALMASVSDTAATADALFDGMLGPYVKINPDNSVVIGAPIADMGTGVETALPMMVAEELDANWDDVIVERVHYGSVAGKDGQKFELFGTTGSGGSGAVRRGWALMRDCGALARKMLVKAAAQELGVNERAIKTANGYIQAGGQSYPYAKYADAALKLPMPGMHLEDVQLGNDINVRRVTLKDEKLSLKKSADYKIVGTGKVQKNAHAIVTGTETFGIDMDIEGQRFAVIARCPHVGGDVESYDDSEAKKIKGVTKILKMSALATYDVTDKPNKPGIAVIATSLWAAMKARDALKIEWNKGPQAHVNNAWLEESADRLFNEAERSDRLVKGDFDGAIASAETVIENTYTLPYFGHFNMEPMNAAAHHKGDSVLIRMSHQSPGSSAMEVADFTGLPVEKIKIEHGRIGCGFGRKWSWDNVMEAVHLSKEVGTPIKVFWTREDDAQHDYLNPHIVFNMKAGLDKDGNMKAWGGAFVCQWGSRLKGFPAPVVENVKIEGIRSESQIPVGAWRGPGNNVSGYVIESMMTQAARQLGEDPLDFRLRILGKDAVYPSNDWAPMTNPEQRLLNSAKTKGVLKHVAKMANWGKEKLPSGWGRAIASHMTFGGYAAFVVDVSVTDGAFKIEHVFGAVDCGQVINKLGALAQIEGGIHDALSTILYQEIEVNNGCVESLNFDQVRMVRMDEAPKNIQIEFIDSDEEPWGLGEIALPAAIPAMVGAIEDATGKTITRLPIGDQLSI